MIILAARINHSPVCDAILALPSSHLCILIFPVFAKLRKFIALCKRGPELLLASVLRYVELQPVAVDRVKIWRATQY
jgi:hypothetical protein